MGYDYQVQPGLPQPTLAGGNMMYYSWCGWPVSANVCKSWNGRSIAVWIPNTDAAATAGHIHCTNHKHGSQLIDTCSSVQVTHGCVMFCCEPCAMSSNFIFNEQDNTIQRLIDVLGRDVV